MATVTFQYPNIIVDTEAGLLSEINVQEVYSRWKEFVKTSDALDAPAFSLSVGGDPLDPTTFLDGYFFLRNDLGWRIRPDERSHQLKVTGNLFGADVLLPIFSPTLGAFTVDVQLVLTSRALVRETGVSGLTGAESAALIQAAADAAAAKVAQEHFQKMADGARTADDALGVVKVFIPGGDPDDDGDLYKWAYAFADSARTEPYDGADIKATNEFQDPPIPP